MNVLSGVASGRSTAPIRAKRLSPSQSHATPSHFNTTVFNSTSSTALAPPMPASIAALRRRSVTDAVITPAGSVLPPPVPLGLPRFVSPSRNRGRTVSAARFVDTKNTLTTTTRGTAGEESLPPAASAPEPSAPPLSVRLAVVSASPGQVASANTGSAVSGTTDNHNDDATLPRAAVQPPLAFGLPIASARRASIASGVSSQTSDVTATAANQQMEVAQTTGPTRSTRRTMLAVGTQV
jgi:hypothetical protein